MKTSLIPYTAPSANLIPQNLIKTLGRLQAQAPDLWGSIYVYDLVEQRTVCTSCSVATLLGYTSEDLQFAGDTGLAYLIHPDDLDRVSEHFQRFTVLQSGQTISIHYRMRHKDGSWCWFRSQETPLVMASDGFPLQILGMIQPRNIEWLL